ncbi:MAG: hypothetical protein HYY45_21585 [Deltaproteobacteria bacterium]|nr:hypothetical protein [Deltaproteobacteria bacterium]
MQSFSGGGNLSQLIFSPDPLSRFQHEKVYGAQRGSADDRAVRELMLAVLEDAIACFESTNANLVQEAEEWINSDDDEVFSFNNVCESLGLDPDRLRKGLLRWKAQQMGVPLEERSRLILSKGKRGKKKTQVKA